MTEVDNEMINDHFNLIQASLSNVNKIHLLVSWLTPPVASHETIQFFALSKYMIGLHVKHVMAEGVLLDEHQSEKKIVLYSCLIFS